MRYVGQWRSLTVPVSTPLEENLDASLERFHDEHEREYAFSDRDQVVEIYGLRVSVLAWSISRRSQGWSATATSIRHEPASVRSTLGRPAASSPPRSTTATRLPAGATFDGPAIVEQMDSTVVVPPDWRAAVDDYGNIVLRLQT